MAYALKNARVKPTAATLTTIYTVPGATTTVVSSIVATNLSATPTTFRIAVQPLGAAIDDSHYLYYDVVIPGNDTFVFTGGITLIATDVISVYATLATLSFNLFFQEIT